MNEAALKYTHARAEEYCAYSRSITPWPHRDYPPRYKTKLIKCPCGSKLPCPNHEEFTDSFWSMSPFSAEYAQALLYRNLPMPENLQSYAA